jgi:hypothetical protein
MIEVTQDKLSQFADVTGDHQWIHVDIERAKRESPFKGPVAQGFLTLSLIPALEIPRDWNVTSFRSLVNYARTSSAYSRPSRQAPRSMRARVWSSRAKAAGNASHNRDPGPGVGHRTSVHSSTREFSVRQVSCLPWAWRTLMDETHLSECAKVINFGKVIVRVGV